MREYRELFHDGAESPWLPEEGGWDSLTGLRLNVFMPHGNGLAHRPDHVHLMRSLERKGSQLLGMKRYDRLPEVQRFVSSCT